MECGFARIEITPPFPVSLFGYPIEERIYQPATDQMLDPLEARALYMVGKNEPGILLLSLDLCILFDEDSYAFRRAIGSTLQLPLENVLIACTHTHSAPLARLRKSQGKAPPENRFISDPEDTAIRYGQWILKQILKIGPAAIIHRAPVKLSFRETHTGLGYNRRVQTSDGILNCWNLREFPDRVPEPAKQAKHGVLRMDYEDRPGGILLESVGVHPVVMGKRNHAVSADWPGYARRVIEAHMKQYQPLFFQGAAGEVHPWLATQNDPQSLNTVGEAIGSEAVLMAEAGKNISLEQESIKPQIIRIPGSNYELTAISLGSLLILLLPFELSSSWAMEITRSLNREVFFICLANGWGGYWMSPAEFEEGGYEIEVARSKGITPEHSKALLKALIPLRDSREV